MFIRFIACSQTINGRRMISRLNVQWRVAEGRVSALDKDSSIPSCNIADAYFNNHYYPFLN
jgi:ribosomal protein S26